MLSNFFQRLVVLFCSLLILNTFYIHFSCLVLVFFRGTRLVLQILINIFCLFSVFFFKFSVNYTIVACYSTILIQQYNKFSLNKIDPEKYVLFKQWHSHM